MADLPIDQQTMDALRAYAQRVGRTPEEVAQEALEHFLHDVKPAAPQPGHDALLALSGKGHSGQADISGRFDEILKDETDPCKKEREAFRQATEELMLMRQSGPEPSFKTVDEFDEPNEISEERLELWDANKKESAEIEKRWKEADHALNECQKKEFLAMVGHSGQHDVSERADEILKAEIDPLKGWTSKRDSAD